MVAAIELGTKIGDVLQPNSQGHKELNDVLKKGIGGRRTYKFTYSEFLVVEQRKRDLKVVPIVVSMFPSHDESAGNRVTTGALRLTVSRKSDLWNRIVASIGREGMKKINP